MIMQMIANRHTAVIHPLVESLWKGKAGISYHLRLERQARMPSSMGTLLHYPT